MQIKNVTSFIKTAVDTAEYFGFHNIDTLRDRKECRTASERVTHSANSRKRRTDSLHGLLASGVNTYCSAKLNGIEEPVLFYTLDKVPRSGEVALTLQVFGVEKSIAEAILIQTTRSLVSELGFTKHNIRVNSLGDKDSTARYVRELTNYMRKHINSMPASAREIMKDHILSAFMHLADKNHELVSDSPNSMEYLSDYSRRHFREIIEYLDMSTTPYEIDSNLVGHDHCYSGALFAIDFLDDDGEIIPDPLIYIRGGRYSEFVDRHSNLNRQAAGAVIVLRKHQLPVRVIKKRRSKRSKVYLVQLGFGPKVRALTLIQQLRQAGIPVRQNIVSDSLSMQLEEAEANEARYAVIMGQKEFIDESVILRNLTSRTQEVIPVANIIGRLKRLAI